MKLYNYFRSSAAYRTSIAFNLKGILPDTVEVDLRAPVNDQLKPDYRSINPQALVPALTVEDTTIAQSLAIIEYLDETYPDPPLMPRSPVNRARVRAMALAIACDMHPLNNLRVLNYLRSPLGQDEETVNAWYRHWIAVGFGGLEQEARRATGDGRHMFGQSVTVADIYLVPQMFNARRFNVDLAPYPTLVRCDAEACALEPFAAAHPDRVAPEAVTG